MRLTLLIILAVIVLLILLIFVVPYGVDVRYESEILKLGIKAGPIRIWLLPKKPKSEKQQAKAAAKKKKKQEKKLAKKAKKEEAKKKEVLDESEKVKPKKKPDIRMLFALLPMGAHAIRRFFRSFSIDYLGIHLTVASDDPYKTATQYSAVCAAVETLPELAGKVIHVKHRDYAVGMDFTADKSTFDVRATLSLQLCKIVHVAFAFAYEFISWKIKHRDTTGAEDSERMNDNGRKQDQ